MGLIDSLEVNDNVIWIFDEFEPSIKIVHVELYRVLC